ncbi:MAG: trigger factor [Chloroflexi bacterium]|nr:MAG: trigger factor [Chloroflexota bacterium]
MVTVSTRPEPGSKVVLEIGVEPAEVNRHFAAAYRHVAERTRVPGFRPGKAPRHVIDRFVGHASVLTEAIDHLISDSYDRALDQIDLIPIDQPQVDIDPADIREGSPARFTATVSVRPEVQLGAYTGYPFGLEIPSVDDGQVDEVLNDLRAQQATLRPIDERPAQMGDVAAVRYTGTIDGEPFEGGSSDRMPLVLGEDRMIPGFEEQVAGMRIGEEKGFEVSFPDDYRVERLRGKRAHFQVTLVDLRERIVPELDAAFVKSVSEVDTVEALGAEIADALRRRAQEEARHQFADRIIEFAAANATVELPEVMVANEIEIMRDELANRLAQQQIGMPQYLELMKQTPEELATELREPASRRVKTLLVLSAIAEREGIDATEAQIADETERQLARYGDQARLREYLTSRRGRSYLRMTLRNRTLVETLIDRALGTAAPSAEPPDPEPTVATAPPTE